MEIQINITLKLSTDYNLRWIYDPVYDKLEQGDQTLIKSGIVQT